MVKTLIFFCMLSFGFSSFGQQGSGTNDYKLFAQATFVIPTEQDMLALEADIRQHPNVIMVRLDFNTQRVLLYTKDISSLSENDFRSWFGTYATTLQCVQIGVNGIDTMNHFPFQNCN